MFIVKVFYTDKDGKEYVGLERVLQTKLPQEQVVGLIQAHTHYQVFIAEQPYSKKLPPGHYESFAIDSICSVISRLRFVDVTETIIPTTVYTTHYEEKEL